MSSNGLDDQHLRPGASDPHHLVFVQLMDDREDEKRAGRLVAR